jgi:hypothetical protein
MQRMHGGRGTSQGGVLPATVRVKVINSPQFRQPQFKGWIAGMNGKLKIVEQE